MTVAKLISKVVNVLPKMEGVSARMTLSAKQIEAFAAKADNETQKLLQEGLKKYNSPTLDVAYKVKSNYAIAGLRLKDGKNVVSQGAISLTNPGQANSAIKVRLSESNGEYAKGFFDAGKTPNIYDMSAKSSRKSGIISNEFRMGDVYGHNIRVSEGSIIDHLRLLGKDKVVDNYLKMNRDIQNKLQNSMTDVRQVLQGNYQPPNFTFEKVYAPEALKANSFSKIKQFDAQAFKDVIKKAYGNPVGIKKINMEEILKKYPELNIKDVKYPKDINEIISKYKK